MDSDIQTNLTLDSDAELKYTASYNRIVQEVVLTIYFVIGMFADVLIFYTIFCYKRIRTVPNIFIANWAIADLLALMLAPSGYRILSVITKTSISHEFVCFVEEFGATFHLTVNLFVTVSLIDWFIAAHFGHLSVKFRDNYVVIIGTIWVFAITFGSICSGICFHYYSIVVHYVISLVITYCLALLLVVLLQSSRVVLKLRRSPINSPTIALTLGSAYVICCLLNVISLISGIFMWYYRIMETLIIIILFSSSIVNLALLCALNNEFRDCLFLAIRCSSSDYEETLSDFNNPIRIRNNQTSESEISFRVSQELLTNID